MNNSNHQRAYDCYLKGMSIEQCCEEIDKSYKVVKTYYTNFTVASMKNKSNDSLDKLMQIREIEDVLFKYLAKSKKDDYDWKKIDELSGNYSRFNALN